MGGQCPLLMTGCLYAQPMTRCNTLLMMGCRPLLKMGCMYAQLMTDGTFPMPTTRYMFPLLTTRCVFPRFRMA